MGMAAGPSGAPVPGAQVILAGNETGETRSLTTGQEGRHTFDLLKIGECNISVEAQGFRRAEVTAGVRSAKITSVNPKLEVGQVMQQPESGLLGKLLQYLRVTAEGSRP